MATQSAGDEITSGRRVCFLIDKWSHPTSVLAWVWLRQYFLRRDSDSLYIVHTGKDDKWKVGGPLGPDLDTALQRWPHTVSPLPQLQQQLAAFLELNRIDVVVLGEDSVPRQGVQMTTVSEWVKTNIRVPFIIIRAAAVRNQRLRISAHGTALHPESPAKPAARPASPDAAPGRRVAIAYPSFAVGRHLIERAKHLVLAPQDEVFVVHCFTSEPKVVRHTKTLLRTLTGGGTAPPPDLPARSASAGGGSEVTEDATAEFGAQELAGHVGTLHLGVVLRGDPRASLAAFCEAEHMDVLVISTRAGGRIRKTLSGGSVSGHLIDHAPCPALVVPYRALNIPRDEDDEPLSPRSPPGGAALGAGLGAEGGRGSGSGGVGGLASVAALQAALEGKDREIAELREEVRRLRLAAAESADVGAHAPLAAPQPY